MDYWRHHNNLFGLLSMKHPVRRGSKHAAGRSHPGPRRQKVLAHRIEIAERSRKINRQRK